MKTIYCAPEVEIVEIDINDQILLQGSDNGSEEIEVGGPTDKIEEVKEEIIW